MKKIIFIYIVTVFASVAKGQTITTYAGTGTAGCTGDYGEATNAQIRCYGITGDRWGNIYLADFDDDYFRKIDPSGIITTIAGIGPFYSGGSAVTCDTLYTGVQATEYPVCPFDIAVDDSGNIYGVETGDYKVMKISAATGLISAVAGNGIVGNSGDNGPATNAKIGSCIGICIDKKNNIYFIDVTNNRIRKVDTSGKITAFAGNGTASCVGDNCPATAASIGTGWPLSHMTADAIGNIFFPDGCYKIRKVDTNGIITTIAGTGVCCYNGDGILATSAQLGDPTCISVDRNGRLYFTDEVLHRVRMIGTDGIIYAVAGDGVAGYSGDNGPATLAKVNYPMSIYVDTAGTIFINDFSNYRIRKISAPLGIRETENRECSVKVSPNPATNLVYLTINSLQWPSGSVITAYNLSGQQVYRLPAAQVYHTITGIPGNTIEVNTTDWIDGVYLFVVQTGGEVRYEKVVVRK